MRRLRSMRSRGSRVSSNCVSAVCSGFAIPYNRQVYSRRQCQPHKLANFDLCHLAPLESCDKIRFTRWKPVQRLISSQICSTLRARILTTDRTAIPSRRHNSEIEHSPRRPSSTMRIFSSAENFRRVLRLISFTCLSADPFGPVLDLILYPFQGL